MRIPGRKRRPAPAAPADLASPLELDVASAPFGTVLTIGGELDMATAPQVRAAAAAPAVAGSDAVVVDLSGITFMDSTGIGVFLALDRDLRARGGRLAIACPEGAARLLFDVTGLNEQLPLHWSREAAVAAVSADSG